jgi:hypothetical protein
MRTVICFPNMSVVFGLWPSPGNSQEAAAAAIYLKHRPGDYETVRRVLGHRDINTTVRFYCGLQTMEATEQFGRLIREQINFEPLPDR